MEVLARLGFSSSQSNFRSSSDEMVGMGKDGLVWGYGWICWEQRILFKVMSNGRVGNERNSVAREREEKEPQGPGVTVEHRTWGELTGDSAGRTAEESTEKEAIRVSW